MKEINPRDYVAHNSNTNKHLLFNYGEYMFLHRTLLKRKSINDIEIKIHRKNGFRLNKGEKEYIKKIFKEESENGGINN